MKKYNQLLLLLTSTVSLTLFLIYHHEYNRLHYVLEVFNFFGQQPCNLTDFEVSNNVLNHHDWGPPPAWRSHDPDLSVYSSYWLQVEDRNVSRSVVLWRKSDKKGPDYDCYLWQEGRNKPVIGRLTYEELGSNNSLAEQSCLFDCYAKLERTARPYAVSFSRRSGTKQARSMLNINGTVIFREH